MKKLIVVSLVLMVISSIFNQNIFAQSIIEKGIKVGINISDGNGQDGDLPRDKRFGIVFGGYVSLKISEKFSLQQEFLLSQKGFDVDFSSLGLGISRIKLTYLEFPALFNYAIISRKTTGLKIYTGPALAFKLSGEADFMGQKSDLNIIERYEYSLVFGARVNSGPLFIESRFTIGLSNISKDSIDESKLTNSLISFLGGISF